MIDLCLVSTTPGLVDALCGYDGLQISSLPALARVAARIACPPAPHALYLEDSTGTSADLWAVVRAAQDRQIPTLVGLHGAGLAQRADLMDAGLPVTEVRDAATLAAWIGTQLEVQRQGGAGHVTIAVAGAKGGIGKTLVVAMLAEGFLRRGLRVLVLDGDLSNSGLVPTFRIPSGFPSYLDLAHDGLGAWTAAQVQRQIYRHAPSGIDFLLGSEETANPIDLTLREWQALMQAVRQLAGYDVVLLDTGPEIKKRPYALDAARNGGYVVLPTPPGRKERTGVGQALQVFAQHTPDLTGRCFLLYMEPEHGGTVSVERVAPLFAQTWPQARPIGRLPRAPRQVSIAEEEGVRYLSPLDVAPHSRYTRAVQHSVQMLCEQIGLHPPSPLPRSSLWQRIRGERIVTVPLPTPWLDGVEVLG